MVSEHVAYKDGKLVLYRYRVAHNSGKIRAFRKVPPRDVYEVLDYKEAGSLTPSKEPHGVLRIGRNVVLMPANLIGKKVRFVVEIVEDESYSDKVSCTCEAGDVYFDPEGQVLRCRKCHKLVA